MSGEKKAKGWRFYGLVGFGAIALLSAGVWALQYAGSGPEKTLSPLVVHNNLQIDLNEPDLFLDSDSLSQLPKDLLTIPFLHDVLSEDFVFYYQNHADRLGIEGSIRRIVYEHDLTLKDKLFSSLLDQPAQAALWHDNDLSVYHVRLKSGQMISAQLQNAHRHRKGLPTWGDEVRLCWEVDSCVVLTV